MMNWEGHVSLTGEGRKSYRVLMGRPKVHHLEDLSVMGDNIKMDLKE
jgi:hypothetical protein